MMDELSYLAEISEKMDVLIDKVDIVADKIEMMVFIGIFAIMIHYVEKWLKIGLNANKNSGRIN